MPHAANDESRVRALAAELEATGARLTLELAGGGADGVISIGSPPAAALVRVKTREALRALARRDHLRIGEAYLDGSIDVEGDLLEVMKATDGITLAQGPFTRLGFALRLLMSPRLEYDRTSIAAHYDRPAEFFLPKRPEDFPPPGERFTIDRRQMRPVKQELSPEQVAVLQKTVFEEVTRWKEKQIAAKK